MNGSEWKQFLSTYHLKERPGQFEGVSRVDRIFASGQNDRHSRSGLVLEAPTGTGKTLMYLAPLRLHPEYRAVISTAGKLLQEQIRRDIIKFGFRPDDAVFLKGRANYICETACRYYLENPPKDEKNAAELKLFCADLETTAERETESFLKNPKYSRQFKDFLRGHLTASSAFCRSHHPGYSGSCFYSELIGRATNARIIITNHHALFALASAGETPQNLFLRRSLIMDEAHMVPEAASSVFSKMVSSDQLRRLVSLIDEYCGQNRSGNMTPFRRILNVIRRLLELFPLLCPSESVLSLDRSDSRFPARAWPELLLEPGRLDDLEEDLGWPDVFSWLTVFNAVCNPDSLPDRKDILLDEIKFALSEIRDVFYLIAGRGPIRTTSFTDSFQNAVAKFSMKYRFDNYTVCYVAGTRDGWELKCSPIDLSPLLSAFWPLWNSWAALSATLTLPDSQGKPVFRYYCEQCAFPDSDLSAAILPEVFSRKQYMVFIPEDAADYGLKFHHQPEIYLEKRWSLTAALAYAFRGRTLSLYTASARMRAGAALMKRIQPDRLRCEVLSQGAEYDNGELARLFKEKQETLLLATRSFFQGFDAPGETLSCVILEKLPFERLDDPILAARIKLAGENGFMQVYLPDMLMKLRQIAGRLIRTEQDRGIFILADSRFMAPACSYREQVYSALKLSGAHDAVRFSQPAEILQKIPHGFLPFQTEDPGPFLQNVFAPELEIFKNTADYRKLTGIRSLDELLKQFGITELHDWQKTIIDNICSGVPAQLAVYPTGSGKSLTYQIPALMRPCLTLVVSPLRSLMEDQVNALKKKGFQKECAYLNSSMDAAERESVFVRLIQGQIRLLYVAPEKLHRNFIAYLPPVSLLVVDEAHMVYQAGIHWRPLYSDLDKARELLGNPQLLAVTATAGQKIRQALQNKFDIPEQFIYQQSVVREKVSLLLCRIGQISQHYALVKKAIESAHHCPVLVYCSTIRYVRALQQFLTLNRIPSVQYHGGLSAEERQTNHQKFLDNDPPVMVATYDSYGMGIDKPDIRGVVFNNVPISLEELVQGIGRVCRNRDLLKKYADSGRPAFTLINYNPYDIDDQVEFKIKKPFEQFQLDGEILLNKFPNQAADYCVSCDLGDSLDEQKMKTCSVLSRFFHAAGKISHREYLQDGYFDWRQSCYHFIGLKNIDSSLRSDFPGFIKAYREAIIRRAEDVRDFCTAAECYNEFLHIYFSGQSANIACGSCGHCGFDLQQNDLFIQTVEKQLNRPARPDFPDGIFEGSEQNFIAYLKRIRASGQRAAKIANLRKQHTESALQYSDCAFAADLLELLDENSPERMIDPLFRILDGLESEELPPESQSRNADVLNGLLSDDAQILRERIDLIRTIRRYTHDFVPGPKPESYIWQTISESWEDLQIEDLALPLKNALIARLGNFPDHWQLIQNRPSEEVFFERLKKENDQWISQLEILLLLAPEVEVPNRQMYLRQIRSRSDFFRLLSVEPDTVGPDDVQWLLKSEILQSPLIRRFHDQTDEFIMAEFAPLAKNFSEPGDLLDKMPLAGKLYPEWIQVIKWSLAKKTFPDFNDLTDLPDRIRDAYGRLPFCLKDFLKRKVSPKLNGGSSGKPPAGPKIYKSFQDL
ncbi:MAG: DEAD/DEAH box helicase [Lentisphaerae bacterium]|nr:DEAD/DEAH box helicase [Lentisphaerota bacterium]